MLRRSGLSRKSMLRRLAIVHRRVYTGPPAKARALVRIRADHMCEWPGCGRVGTDYHHRLNRKMGGRFGARRTELNSPAWVVLACRTHHEHVTSASGVRLVDVRAMGWVLTEEQIGTDVAVQTRRGWLLLGNSGGWMELP